MNAGLQAEEARAVLKQDAKSLDLIEFWEQRADVELLQPRNRAKPFRWKWTDIEPRLRVAAKTVPIEECERALVFANPGLEGKPYITNTLFAAYSLYNPGERAPVHRHTPSASRFVWKGTVGSRWSKVKNCGCTAATDPDAHRHLARSWQRWKTGGDLG